METVTDRFHLEVDNLFQDRGDGEPNDNFQDDPDDVSVDDDHDHRNPYNPEFQDDVSFSIILTKFISTINLFFRYRSLIKYSLINDIESNAESNDQLERLIRKYNLFTKNYNSYFSFQSANAGTSSITIEGVNTFVITMIIFILGTHYLRKLGQATTT